MRSNKFNLMFQLGIFLLAAAAWAGPEVPVHVRDTDGNFLTFPSGKEKALVLFFADRNCPVANKYIPKLNDLST